MLSHVILALALAIFTKAAPAPNSAPSCKSTTAQELATFDDIEDAIPTDNFNQIPDPYKGVNWAGFDFADTVNLNLSGPGLEPHSGNNYAISTSTTTELGGTATLTINFPNGPANTVFTLEDFYYGCVLDVQTGLAGVPTQCNIELTGYKGPDNSINDATQLFSRQFQFNPTTSLGTVQMAYSGDITQYFKDVSFIVVQYSLPGGTAAANPLLALFFDSVNLAVTTCK